jgi:kinesin family protein 20
VNVESGSEAYKVFTFGKKNLNISSTLLNTSSSRSHSIFTIRLVRKHHLEEDSIYVSRYQNLSLRFQAVH